MENVLENDEKMYTIEELHQRKLEAEALEKRDKIVTAELEEIIDKDENEIGE